MNSWKGIFVLFIFCQSFLLGGIHAVGAAGFAFSPTSLSVNAGDTVVFSIGSFHNAVEVSQSTYDANGTTALVGGFAVPFGGGRVVTNSSQIGMHYFICQAHATFGMKGTLIINSVTGVTSNDFQRPNEYRLAQNFPNPFNPTTKILYSLPSESRVQLIVYNSLGERVATLLHHQIVSAGEKSIAWDASNMTSGIYFYHLEASDPITSRISFSQTKKMVLLK